MTSRRQQQRERDLIDMCDTHHQGLVPAASAQGIARRVDTHGAHTVGMPTQLVEQPVHTQNGKHTHITHKTQNTHTTDNGIQRGRAHRRWTGKTKKRGRVHTHSRRLMHTHAHTCTHHTQTHMHMHTRSCTHTQTHATAHTNAQDVQANEAGEGGRERTLHWR